MLQTLRIKNIAIIDSAEIPFKKGLNVLSGETGAGKSIVLEAISLLLGSRAHAELIRTGCDEAVVEGLFDISDIEWMPARLERLGFSSENSELLIKRVVHRNGRHRIYVNGELATLSILQELGEDLIDLCGQNEHQSLTKSLTQLSLLDRYGSLETQADKVSVFYTRLSELRDEETRLREAEGERSRKADFLKFQIEELRGAELQPGEEAELQSEKQLLQSAETRVQTAESSREILESDESGTLNTLRGALQKLRALEQLDDRSTPMVEALERALAECEEVSLSLHRYLGSVDLNPERLETVQDRLSRLVDLRRKYGATVEDMIRTLARLEEEFSGLGQAEDRLSALTAEIAEVTEEFTKAGRKLSAARRKVATSLGAAVTGEIKDLRMGEAEFSIELQAREDVSEWNAHGADQIQFVVRTNAGEAARPIGKIASGGELSRLMLAIRRVIADKGGIGVYLFDEVDAGIGGQTAFQVGKKLKSVAAFNQVLCITHLPQVASFADHHLVVRKSTQGKRTLTEVIELREPERKEELARMLAGPQLTKKSLENAAELLELARV